VEGGNLRATANFVGRHPRHDVAILEVLTETYFPEIMLAEEVPEGTPCTLCGFGPELQGGPDRFCFPGTYYETYVKGDNWQHTIPGDSGGPVVVQHQDGRFALAGIHIGFTNMPPGQQRLVSRNTVSRHHPEVVIVNNEELKEFVSTQYGVPCPTCPNLVKPEIRQPMIGIGIPVGPPSIVGVTPYPPRQQSPPQVVPVISDEAIGRAVAAYIQNNPESFRGVAGQPGSIGPQGNPGPPGQTGPRGEPGPKPSPEEVVPIVFEVVRAMMEDDPERFRGPPGEKGMIGVPSEEEVNVWIEAWLHKDPRVLALMNRIDSLESEVSRLRDRKISIVQGEQLADGSIRRVGPPQEYSMDKPIPIVTIRKDLQNGK